MDAAWVDGPALFQVSVSISSGAMEVQIFGVRKNADTRKALRFFSERRIKTHFVDLDERAASLGELRRFAQKFGIGALIDSTSQVFQELGLRHARMSDESWLDKLVDEPVLLRIPLVRTGNQLTVGLDEATWKVWSGR
ncbi:MAG: arsenate reductase [Gemmatimonadota bacterium]|nr:arsenate reductase [Gemmatimonadota bacterium]